MFDRDTFLEFENFFYQEHAQSFVLLPGHGPVMISAPHCVEQLRNGRIKAAEPQTGALAKMLHHTLGCPVIYKTKNCNDDANFDENCLYKQALSAYINSSDILFLLDLHQLAPHRKMNVAIGTGKHKNVSRQAFINATIEAFCEKKITKIKIDDPFGATYPFTVSSYIASTCGISCLQIEINSKILRLDTEDSQTEQVFEALVDSVKKLTLLLQEEKHETT